MPHEMQATVKTSAVGGDGLFALVNLKAGDQIFRLTRPVITALDTRFLIDACSNCFILATDPRGGLHDPNADEVQVRACTGCRILRYCSKQCQVESWKRHHKPECKLFRQHANRGPLSNTMRAVLQMLNSTLDAIPSPFNGMKSHLELIAKQGGERYDTIQILSAGIHRVFHPSKSVALIQQYFAMVQTNSFTLNTPTFDPIGVALDPFAAKANHSCDPNAFVVFDGAQISFRCLRPIAKDEEIYISYIDINMPFARRQAQLREQYCFTCNCGKCQCCATLKEDLFQTDPTNLNSDLSRKIRDILAIADATGSGASQQEDNVNEDTALAELAGLENFAFCQLDQVRKFRGPSLDNSETIAALKALKEGLKACQLTSIWPEHREPIPALRQELFVTLLFPGFEGVSWSYAFMQGLKLYFDIHPVLYPEPFHPSKVIHKWTMANLAFFLAHPDTHVADELKDIDLGVVIFGLLTEVQDNVRRSHGEGSRFARAVQNKLDQVVVDMTRGDGTQLQGIRNKIQEQWTILRRVSNTPYVDAWMSRV